MFYANYKNYYFVNLIFVRIRYAVKKQSIFSNSKGLVVDPTEERMRDEFAGTKILHLPMHSVVRIEEVEKRGTCLIRDRESGEKITPFPLSPPGKA